MDSLQKDFPWTSFPLVAAAPMRLICLSKLAVEVSKAGGLGFIGGGNDLCDLDKHLSQAADLIRKDPRLSQVHESTGVLPVGFGVLNWGAELAEAAKAVEKWNPAAVWFFAPREMRDLVEWTDVLRKKSKTGINGKPVTQIWVQVGTVQDALEVARSCRPDVLMVQGTDAGGHGLVRGASVISLLPEVADVLSANGFQNIPLIAAGGIVEGRGVAAALALGAKGVALGTRFLATPEAEISDGYRNAILQANDGGITTIRSTVYDQLRGVTQWPTRYDGRGVINQSYIDHTGGLLMSDNLALYNNSLKLGDAGWGISGRLTTYAGTGVGLITQIKPAGEVVREVQQDARKHLERAVSRCQKLAKSKL